VGAKTPYALLTFWSRPLNQEERVKEMGIKIRNIGLIAVEKIDELSKEKGFPDKSF